MSWLSDIFGGKAAKQQAAEAQRMQADIQAREDKRQSDIKAGQGAIEGAYAQFNLPYYDAFKQSYVNTYNPQIADQFGEAQGKLTSQLAGRGMLESTTGANAFGKLQKTRSDAEATIGNNAQDAANALRSTVENSKNNMFGLNLSAADPASVGAQAQAQAGAIVSPAATPSLGSVFGAALQPFANFNKADNTSMTPRLPWNQFNPAPTSGRGTAAYIS